MDSICGECIHTACELKYAMVDLSVLLVDLLMILSIFSFGNYKGNVFLLWKTRLR